MFHDTSGTMPLLDYISRGDDRQVEVARFLSDRWQDILDEEPVFGLRVESGLPTWAGDRFEVREVRVGDDIRAQISFRAKGYDERSNPTGDEITGSAVAVIDEYDNVEFVDVTAA